RRWSDARAAGGSGAYRAATCSQRLPTAPTTRTPCVSGPTGMFPHSFSSTPQGYALQASCLLDPKEGEGLGEVDRSRLRKLVAKTGRPVQGVVLLQDRPALEGLRALEAAQGSDDRTPHLGQRQRAERLRGAERADGEGAEEGRETGLPSHRQREQP